MVSTARRPNVDPRRRQQYAGEIPEEALLELQFGKVLNHTMLRHLLPKRMQQHLNPLSLGGNATKSMLYNVDPLLPQLKFDQPAEMLRFCDERHLMVRTGWDDQREYFMYLIFDSYCIFMLDGHSSKSRTYRKACLERFKHHVVERKDEDRTKAPGASTLTCFGSPSFTQEKPSPTTTDEPIQLMVFLATFTPDDIKSPWFPSMAACLMHTSITLSIELKTGPLHSLFPTQTSYASTPTVNGLTALLLAMKAHLSLRSLARIFSYAPTAIAQEIHIYNLAPALGTQATKYLLSCIFDTLRSNAYRTDQPTLISAATHLLVAHIARSDNQSLLSHAVPGTRQLVADRLTDLLNIQHTSPPTPLFNFTLYAHMAALRDGIIYGAMRAYAADLDAHNQANVDALRTFAASVTSLASAASSFSPGGGVGASAAVTAAGGMAVARLNRWVGNRWVKGELDRALEVRFGVEVEAPAGEGWIPRMSEKEWLTLGSGGGGGGGVATGKDGVGVDEKEDGDDTKRTGAIGKQERNRIVQDVYLPNVNFVMAFAMDGTVTTRASYLPTKGVQRGRRRRV